MISLERLSTFFRDLGPPDGVSALRQDNVRAAAERMSLEVVINTPKGEEQDKAIEKIREAMMWAAAAIVCRPHGLYNPKKQGAGSGSLSAQDLIDATKKNHIE